VEDNNTPETVETPETELVEYFTDWFPYDSSTIVRVVASDKAAAWDNRIAAIGVQGRADFNADYTQFRVAYAWFGPEEFNEDELNALITDVNSTWKEGLANV
jgi:hypothetical protein